MKPKLSRRRILKGVGGAILGLPFLEGLSSKSASAQAPSVEPFAIFFRQANGVAAIQTTTELGFEPERFWPRDPGALTTENLEGRATAELASYANRLLVVGNTNMRQFAYGDGHARGALQLLTARGPTIDGQGGNSEAAGESLDHRIGRELNPSGNESLFLYAGSVGGWLGGPCISHRSAGNRRSALVDPKSAYQLLAGDVTGASQEAILIQTRRQQSINDLVRGELGALLARPELGSGDRRRLDLHLSSVRDLEISLSCRLSEAEEQALDASAGSSSNNGDVVLATARLHMDLAALAVACGFTRSVAIQVGNGNDGNSQYRDPDTGNLMDNFHFISHRRQSHNSSGSIIAGSDLLHHKVDVQFAATFRHLLDKLAAYEFPEGSLLDAGMAIWMNDLGNGPGHSNINCPVVIAGSAGGFLKQGQFVKLDGGDITKINHARLLNTLGTAAGLRTAAGDPISDFGDPTLNRDLLSELLA